ncbi:hypothetical protein [Streptomyces sp. Tu 3180]|uniref:hypothetical protein n=1 Tax=Streptomyces sp. Tu 3180 TaxID=2682611 RepID=UPI00135CD4D4|nr:hypothetical protein [Streptomyces sp. Tu 3180]KAF3465980.1 hypothetical protein GL259_17675 [Streptomyces sp. Tu 3180]
MKHRGNTLRLTAVSALVVLTLTGFSTGRGHGGGSGDGGGGGGCSSSSQNHDSSSGSGSGSHGDDDHDYDYDYDDAAAGGSGSGSGSGGGNQSSLEDATVELISCADEKAPYATVEVTNPNAVGGTFTVTVDFLDTEGGQVTSGHEQIAVPANGTATVQVPVDHSEYVARITDCALDPLAPGLR